MTTVVAIRFFSEINKAKPSLSHARGCCTNDSIDLYNTLKFLVEFVSRLIFAVANFKLQFYTKFTYGDKRFQLHKRKRFTIFASNAEGTYKFVIPFLMNISSAEQLSKIISLN